MPVLIPVSMTSQLNRPNNMQQNQNAFSVILGAAITMLIASPVAALDINANAAASASTSPGTVQISAATQARMTTAQEHGDKEIDRRVTALTELKTRIQGMAKLAGQVKDTISSSIDAQINTLAQLKAKIDADTELATLKIDIKSITESYRIYMLVIPQGHITVAADRIKTTADVGSALHDKLSARIDAAGTAGKDVTALKTTLTDMQAKIADANAQADAAVTLVATLTPDNGDKEKQTANNQALKDARAKIKAAMQDLIAARKDAGSIVKALAAFNLEGGASASSTATTPTP